MNILSKIHNGAFEIVTEDTNEKPVFIALGQHIVSRFDTVEQANLAIAQPDMNEVATIAFIAASIAVEMGPEKMKEAKERL